MWGCVDYGGGVVNYGGGGGGYELWRGWECMEVGVELCEGGGGIIWMGWVSSMGGGMIFGRGMNMRVGFVLSGYELWWGVWGYELWGVVGGGIMVGGCVFGGGLNYGRGVMHYGMGGVLILEGVRVGGMNYGVGVLIMEGGCMIMRW